MAEIILDLSANTHRNDESIIKRVIDEIKRGDSGRHRIVFKSQLFTSAGANVVCSHQSFDYMYKYSRDSGYQCTSSVFDVESTKFLVDNYSDIPFLKIACNKKYRHLIEYVPSSINIYMSYDARENAMDEKTIMQLITKGFFYKLLYCSPKYPSEVTDYPLHINHISDHTKGLALFKRNEPDIWEKHIKLPDSEGLDSGEFAITPEEISKIL